MIVAQNRGDRKSEGQGEPRMDANEIPTMMLLELGWGFGFTFRQLMSNRSPKVLLIEDNVELAQVISHILRQGPEPSFHCISLPRLDKSLDRLRVGDLAAAVLDL